MAENVLQYTVHVDGVAYRRGTTPPAEVAKKITNPKVWGGALAAAPAGGAVTISTATATTVQETGTEESDAPASFPEGQPDDSWTVKDLRAWAKAQDLTLGEAKTKPQILELIAQHRDADPGAADGDETPAKDEAPSESDTESE